MHVFRQLAAWPSRSCCAGRPEPRMCPEPDPEAPSLPPAVFARAAAGDDAAQSELCRAYWSRVFRFLRITGRSAADAEDITQEVFAEVLRKLRSIRDPASFLSFLICVAKRKSISLWRREQCRPEGHAIEGANGDSPEEFVRFLEDISGSVLVADFVREATFSSLAGTIRDALDQLSERHRAAIELFYFERYSGDEIAAALGLTTNAVHILLTRARALLKERLLPLLHPKDQI